MDHVHVRTRPTSKSNPSKMACEKAGRRLRALLFKASRLGVSTNDVARLPSAKKLIPQRDHGWKIAVFLILMFGGGVIVALICTARRGCSRIEDILYSSSEEIANAPASIGYRGVRNMFRGLGIASGGAFVHESRDTSASLIADDAEVKQPVMNIGKFLDDKRRKR